MLDRHLIVLAIFLPLAALACSSDDGGETPADTLAPPDAADTTSPTDTAGPADATDATDVADADDAEVDATEPADAVNDAWVVTPGEAFAQAAPGVLANDLGALEVVTTTTTSAQGAAVTLAADGGFSYATPERMAGADTFVYSARDTDGTLHDAIVTLTPRAGCGDGEPTPGEVCFARAPLAGVGPASRARVYWPLTGGGGCAATRRIRAPSCSRVASAIGTPSSVMCSMRASAIGWRLKTPMPKSSSRGATTRCG